MHISELYESVTQNIIRELEAGAIPWTKVWESQAGGWLPANAATRRTYNGINVLILWATAQNRHYPTGEWMTFKQALALNACVRKGERATQVVFVKKVEREEGGEKKLIPVMRVFSVFNVAQIDGLIPAAPPVQRPMTERYQHVEAFLGATKATVKHGPFEPCYIPAEDAVCLPPREAFKADEHYYATTLHEHVHWTGPRLERDMQHRFGTMAYAAEELVAELGAAFLCAHLAVKGELRHAGYIDHWLQLLKEDPRAIFTAAAKASEAANYLRAFSEELPTDT